MKIKKGDLLEIIDSNGDIIGKDDIPKTGSDLESQANNTIDYNVKVGTQPFRYDMLGRFGFTLLPFFEGKEENRGQKELLQDLAKLMYDKYLETLEYYFRNPNKLKSDFRLYSKHDFESQPEDKKAVDSKWALKIMKVVEKHFENAFKEPENIDEAFMASLPFDDEIRYELRRFLVGSNYDKGGILDQRVDQLMQIQKPWIDRAKNIYSAEEIAKTLYQYDKNLNSGVKVNKLELPIGEGNVLEDKMVDKKSEDEMSKKAEDREVKEKQVEKIAGLINKKFEKNDIDKLINLLERK